MNRIKITNKYKLADIFNNHFSNLDLNIIKDNNNDPSKNNINNPKFIPSNISVLDNLDHYFNFNNVEINDILFRLKQINKSQSNDIYGYNYGCFKTIILYNTQYFVNLINMSFKEGVFPEILKNSKIIPILKNKSNKQDLNNYKPITTTPIFSKITEKLAHNQIYNFLDKNKLINNNQYGFLKNKSTNSCLDMFKYNIVKNLELKNFYISIFFDCINFDLLFEKLHRLNFSLLSIKWIESYRKNRNQVVDLNGVQSKPLIKSRGVPQVQY